MSSASASERYVLATGNAGAERLRLLQRIYGPHTEDLLTEAGLREGMRVADIGCGIGTVTRFMAQRVGRSGSAVGVDASTEQLEVARADAANAGVGNAAFVLGDAYRTGLERRRFDLVYCRFLLCHLQRPLDALREMQSMLKPGGVLVCEDTQVESLVTIPATPAYAEIAAAVVDHGRRRGVDQNIGAKLPAALQALGMRDVQVRIWQPAFLSGEEKSFWTHSVAEAAPRVIEAGYRTPQEFERWNAAMQKVDADDSILLLLPKMWQVFGRNGG